VPRLSNKEPQDYTEDLYPQILAPSATRSNYSAAARYTDKTHPANNRTRWALQHQLLSYELTYGGAAGPDERAATSTEFSYQIHEFAFQFANDVPTIGRLPWTILTHVDVAALAGVGPGVGPHTPDVQDFMAGHIINATIVYTNPPTGEFPFGGQVARFALDTASGVIDVLGLFTFGALGFD
jgi:hypothetical protein